MATDINLKPALGFLSKLAKNNNKEWFDANRAAYDEARAAFAHFVQSLISEISKFDDLGSLAAGDCIFRINRDIRFSKDKSPYKTNFAANISRGGRKGGAFGYYLHLAPHNGSFLAGGVHMPEPAMLARWRQAVDREAGRIKKIIGQKDFAAQFGKLAGDRLKTAPQGYSKDHPDLALLQLKDVLAMHTLADRDVQTPGIVSMTVKACKALKPFNDYLNATLR